MVEATIMTQNQPEFKDNELYRLLRDENVSEFNKQRGEGDSCDLSGADFRNLVLSKIDAHDIDFSNCYFRGCDLRGIDFSSCNLAGASIHDAQISGVLFPIELDAAEIRLSHQHGTRMRYRK